MTTPHTSYRSSRNRQAKRARFTIKVLVSIGLALAGVYFAASTIEGSLESALTPSVQPGTAQPAPGQPAPTLTPTPTPGDTQQDPAQPPIDAAAASAQLATLPVKGRAPKTGYGRESQFGQAWYDLDGNGCNTRNDVLARDLTVTQLAGNGCVVLAGAFVDPYTGTQIQFQHGEATSPLVQIDHVVALSDAWQKGAQQISAEQRLALANDPLNLLAVDGPTN